MAERVRVDFLSIVENERTCDRLSGGFGGLNFGRA